MLLNQSRFYKQNPQDLTNTGLSKIQSSVESLESSLRDSILMDFFGHVVINSGDFWNGNFTRQKIETCKFWVLKTHNHWNRPNLLWSNVFWTITRELLAKRWWNQTNNDFQAKFFAFCCYTKLKTSNILTIQFSFRRPVESICFVFLNPSNFGGLSCFFEPICFNNFHFDENSFLL